MDVAGQFDADPGYLNTATVGVPPRSTVDAVNRAVEGWARGRLGGPDFDPYVARSRAAFARLVGVDTSRVAVGATASGLIGLIAASIPDGAEVLVAEGDFTSLLYPFAAQAHRGVTLRAVPLAAIADEVIDSTTLVAVSAVQSANGAIVDQDALIAAARVHGAKILLDATQACGWYPIDASSVDYCVCAAYKWLLAPRGVAFLTVSADALDAVVPHTASWYGGADIWKSLYGLPMTLSEDARRLDTSPAWLSWVGAAESLEFLEGVGIDAIVKHDVELANRFRSGLDLPTGESAIVSTVLTDDQRERLTSAGVRTSTRAGRTRFSFHLYTTMDDVDLALSAIAG